MYLLFVFNFLLLSLFFNLDFFFFNEEFLIFVCMSVLFFLLFINLKSVLNFFFFFKIESIYFLFVYLLLLNIEVVNKILNLVILQNLRFNTYVISELNFSFLELVYTSFYNIKFIDLKLLYNNILYLHNALFESYLIFYQKYLVNFLPLYLYHDFRAIALSKLYSFFVHENYSFLVGLYFLPLSFILINFSSFFVTYNPNLYNNYFLIDKV